MSGLIEPQSRDPSIRESSDRDLGSTATTEVLLLSVLMFLKVDSHTSTIEQAYLVRFQGVFAK